MSRTRARIDVGSALPHPGVGTPGEGISPSHSASTLVRALIDRSSQPALALDVEGRVVHANGLFEAVAGRTRTAVLGHVFVDGFVPLELASAARGAVERALKGEVTTLSVTIAQESGAWVELVADALVLDADPRALFLTVRDARLTRVAGASPAFGGLSYVVRETPEGFRVDDGTPCPAAAVQTPGRRCYEQLGGAGTPCGNCPAAAALHERTEQVAVLDSAEPDRFVIVRARAVDAERVAMERVVLETPALFAALNARIRRIAMRADLSTRELDVLDCLLVGRSLEDVGVALGVSRHTAKFHQANILAKLGADSRFDLIRVLF